jgi:hypothetical protein
MARKILIRLDCPGSFTFGGCGPVPIKDATIEGDYDRPADDPIPPSMLAGASSVEIVDTLIDGTEDVVRRVEVEMGRPATDRSYGRDRN